MLGISLVAVSAHPCYVSHSKQFKVHKFRLILLICYINFTCSCARDKTSENFGLERTQWHW